MEILTNQEKKTPYEIDEQRLEELIQICKQ